MGPWGEFFLLSSLFLRFALRLFVGVMGVRVWCGPWPRVLSRLRVGCGDCGLGDE